jgi:hypothetical protein
VADGRRRERQAPAVCAGDAEKKMNCTNCGRKITDTNTSEDGFLFCTPVCRYDWKRNGKPNPFQPDHHQSSQIGVTEIDLDFTIDPPGFENRKMTIHPSYWGAPKLFLDGTRLMPKKRRIFSRKREFDAVSNYGKNVLLQLRPRALDMVPVLYIDGQLFQIARPLTMWEYIWICIPLILLFSGGAIGGMIASMATYSNSILMRKIKVPFLRYLYTGITSFIAIATFVRFVGLVNPLFTSLIAPLTIETQLKQISAELNKYCPQMIDTDTRLDSTSSPGNKTLTYYYTLSNKIKNELNTNEFRKSLTPRIIDNIKSNPQMGFIRDNEITLVYKYSDKNNSEVLNIIATPSDYK